METYILGLNYTGSRPDFSESLEERNDEVFRIMKAAGGTLVAFYRTQGRFDAVAVIEMPDAESMQAFNIANQDEHWRVETMRAFTMDEYPEVWARAKKLLEDAGVQ